MSHKILSGLAAAMLALTTSVASADILRLETTHDPNLDLAISESLDVDVYLDCECAGGAGDESDYVIIQFSVLFDPTILSYQPANSFPNDPTGNPQPGTNSPGIVIFGNQGSASGAIILGGSPADTYYTAKGGPHKELGGAGSGRVLILYTSKQLITGPGTGTSLGGEWYLGTLNFHVIGAGPKSIQARYLPNDLIELSNQVQLVEGTGQRDIKTAGDIFFPIPEPTTALLVGMGLLGLGIGRRQRARG